MDMKSLLEKMMKFAGEPEQKAGDQVRGTDRAKKSGKEHPFKGRLVGDSVEPQTNMLEELSQEAEDKSIEWSLAEAWAEFKEAAFKDTAERRPARKGSRPARDYGKSDEPSKRYKEVEEAGDRAGALNTATQLKRAIENSQNKPAHEIEYLTKQMNALMRKYNIKPEELQTPTGHQQQSRQQTPPPPPPPKGPGVDWAKHQADFEKAHQTYQADFEKAYQASQAELNKAFQASMPPGMMPKTKMAEESAEQLNVGDDVIITGPVEHEGETGVIDSFGQDKRFVVVNLYNHGKKSFHSSDVSYNDYADSDAEEAEMYDRDPEFRDWAAKQEVDEGWGAEPAAARHREQMTAVARVLQKYKNDPVKSKIANYLFVNNWNAPAIEKELANPDVQQKYQANMDKYERQVGPVKDWTDSMAQDYLQGQGLKESGDTPLRDVEDYQAKKKALQDIQMDPSTGQDPELSAELAQRLARLNQQYSELKEIVSRIKESRGHKIIARKLADIERKPSVPSADDDAARAEQAKADYAKYVAKMKKKDPNFVPLYKMDENVPTGQTTMADKTGANDPQQAAKVAQATQALKSATGATAPTPNIAKALDAATQGKPVGAADMKAIEPMMDVLGAAAQDPKLANQFKTLAAQAKQVK